jgi:uncharacterized protein YjiS (DUF1127 family)
MLSKFRTIIERRRVIIERHRVRARDAAWLKRLDDHRLRDLGIARDQIDLLVKGRI